MDYIATLKWQDIKGNINYTDIRVKACNSDEAILKALEVLFEKTRRVYIALIYMSESYATWD